MKSKTKLHDVFFVDDDAGIRSLVAAELERMNCNVICFDNGIDCLEQIGKQNCNLLITDLRMPGMDGLALLEEVRRIAPWISVVIMSGFGDIEMSVRAIKSGAVDFIEKNPDMKAFREKIRSILDRGDYLGALVGKRLTKVEKKVLKLILEGKGNKQAAYSLDRTVRTIERHRSAIIFKS